MTKPAIFISYSQKDEKEKDALVTHLKVLEVANLLEIWSDDDVGPGKAWEMEIDQAISKARVAILLISANYLSSLFIKDEQLSKLLERHQKDGLTIFPVIAKSCAWQKVTWLKKMSVRPKSKEPVWRTGGLHADDELARIAEEVAEIIEKAETSPKPKEKIVAEPQALTAQTNSISAGSQSIAMSLSTPQQNLASSNISSPVDFVIITPLKEERDAVLNKLPGNKRLPPSDQDKRIYYAAQLPVNFSDDSAGVYQIIVMALIKMGRVEASMAAADAIRRWQPRYIILTGIAGGVARNEVKLGDIVISDQIVDYESQKLRHEEDPEMRWKVHQVDHGLVLAAGSLADDQWRDLVSVERPQEDLSNCHIGPIASGDKVISTEEFLNNLLYYWPKLIGVEMEAGGVVLAASQAARSPGFFMVRSVSDLGDKKKSSRQVKKWRSYACDVAASYTIALLQSGPITATKTWRRDTLSVDISEKLLPPNAPRAFLTMYCKDETRRYPLEKKLTRMGRDKRCELEILEICDNVDYFHATILYQEGHFIIIDGNKSNPSRFGTFVNGHKVLLDHPVQLKPQDRIVLGGFRTPAIGELARGACEIIFE